MFYAPIAIPAVIPATQSQSVNLSLAGLHLVEFLMPAGWDAAALTLLGSPDGTTFFPIFNEAGTEVSITVAPSRLIRFPSGFFAGAPFWRLRSGTSATPVNQTASRTITIFARQAQ